MKNGNFICIGNPEKLKLQFSEGYFLQLKFKKQTFGNGNESVLKINDISINNILTIY